MTVFISDKDTVNFTSNILDKITLNLNISVRMSRCISDILKPLKKLAVVYYQV